jgi:hypothetical protein
VLEGLSLKMNTPMKVLTLIVQNLVRLLGVVLLILGFLFWSGHSFDLIRVHMNLGVTLVLLLWVLAGIGIAAKVKPGLVAAAILWGFLTVFFGMTMGRLLPGRAHEIIRVAHFLIGLGAIGLAESLGARIKRATPVLRS